MCRISGFWDFSKKADYNMKTVIDAMNDIQSHGGPDDNGTFLSKKDQFALGHRRLSILDLSKSGHQPMKHKDLIISYNGEVYNFKDIREELKGQGYKFTSDCDTEVIIKAFDKWGIKSVNKFRGMFAFAIFNKKKNELTLVRDRIGIKPIYYYRHKDILIFSSELKGIYKHPKFVKDVDHRGLGSYFKFGYVQGEGTILEHVFKVQPGSYVTINSDGEIEVNTYWSMIDIAKSKEFSGSMNDALTTGLDILRESVKLRMISDVPLGVFLSSGTDSSLVTSIMQEISTSKVKTFTIGFDDPSIDESDPARVIADILGTEHTELICNENHALNIVKQMPDIFDEPFADKSAIPTLLVSHLAKRDVTVSLSADGGDELFYGYSSYSHMNLINNRYSKSAFTKIINLLPVDSIHALLYMLQPQKYYHFGDNFNRLKSIINTPDSLDRFKLLVGHYLPDELNSLLVYKQSLMDKYSRPLSGFDDSKKYTLFDLVHYLPEVILTKVDRSSMSGALEAREPLLDHEFVEFALGIPQKYKYKNGTYKYFLKKMLEQYLPKKMIYRRKKGFSAPINKWLRGPLRDMVMSYLSKDRICEEGLLNPDYVSRLTSMYYSNKGIHPNKIWLLLMFEMWMEKNN